MKKLLLVLLVSAMSFTNGFAQTKKSKKTETSTVEKVSIGDKTIKIITSSDGQVIISDILNLSKTIDITSLLKNHVVGDSSNVSITLNGNLEHTSTHTVRIGDDQDSVDTHKVSVVVNGEPIDTENYKAEIVSEVITVNGKEVKSKNRVIEIDGGTIKVDTIKKDKHSNSYTIIIN